MGLFGGGNSTSTTQQFTTNNAYDQRSITDARQDNTTTNTTTNTSTSTSITALDGGAIDASKSIALAGIADNATNTANLLAVADHLFSTQRQIVDANSQLSSTLAGTTLQSAAQADEKTKMLMYAGIALAAVALFAIGKR